MVRGVERRTAAETRELLLETGIAMLHEQGVTAGVAHIRLQDVLKRTGLTTGAAYRLWSDQSAFHRDLAVAATRWRDDSPLGRTVTAIRELVERKAPLRSVIRQAGATHVEGLAGADGEGTGPSNSFLTALALRAAAAHDDELRAASRDRHQDSLDSFVELYTALLRVYRRQMRPPFTLHQLAATLAALGEGFAVQAIEGEEHPVVHLPVEDGDADADADEPWTMFAVAVRALVEALTEDIPETAPDSIPT
jgi:AcrR family transcriptional regulator